MRILGDFEGSGNDYNRLLSFIRERDAEVELLKSKLIENERKHSHIEFGEIDAKRTMDSLRRENAELSKTIESLRNSANTMSIGQGAGRER
jgi:hypothetical protein